MALAQALSGLAMVQGRQGRHAEAEPLQRGALDMLEQLVGPDHPYVAQALDDLAALFEAQDKTAEAGPLRQRATAMRARLGDE